MTDTITNTPVTAETWINVYDATNIDGGTTINIQNIGVNDLYYSIAQDKPARNTDKYRIFTRSQVIVFDDNDPAIWIFSPQSAGLINVEIVSNTVTSLLESIEALLSEILANNNDQNCTILSELKLSNVRFEETFDTKIKMSDI